MHTRCEHAPMRGHTQPATASQMSKSRPNFDTGNLYLCTYIYRERKQSAVGKLLSAWSRNIFIVKRMKISIIMLLLLLFKYERNYFATARLPLLSSSRRARALTRREGQIEDRELIHA